ncbi:MAG: oligopeptide transport system ATP-binding protein [Chloroflexota bacterium]|nr:oligopeptide transport system ATP-binding protein [Chloroflexota bacterium]
MEDLHTEFFTSGGTVTAVDGVSFEVRRGETLGVVGESGCGKSVTAMSILRLVSEPGKITSGSIKYDGKDVLQLSADELVDYRGNDVGMIFQDPMSSLNPVLKVGFQVEEAMRAHRRFSPKEARDRVVPLLKQVRIPDAEARARDYPHQFSGGMRQRAMIAMALANNPGLVIADEPTTALDVTVQAQIIELLRDLNEEMHTAIMLITHNMAVVASLCTRVIVMYAGQIVEEGPVEQIFENPQHPYTWSLLRSIPRVDEHEHERLRSIEGIAPDLLRPPAGCRFHPRCPFRVEQCYTDPPELELVGPDQEARCWVKMDRAYKEMGAADLFDVSPGAGSGYYPT